VLSRKHPGIGAHIFKQHGGSTLAGRFLRTASRLPNRLTEILGRPVVERAEAHRTDLLTRWALRALRDVQYWKGIEENGGLHECHPVVRVLAYHAIEDVADPYTRNYAVPPEQFECQLHALIEAGFHFIGVDGLLGYLAGWPVPDRSILLTFDDGYANLAQEAAPILKRFGAPAVVFMATHLVGGHNEWDVWRGAAPLLLLSAAQLQDLIAQGWEVGVHSRSHAHLVALAPAAVAEELTQAHHDLHALGLPPPRLFAYPYGEHNAAVRAAVRRAGYVAAFALTATRTDFASHSRFALPRLEVTRSMSPEVLVQRTLDQRIRPLLALERELRGAARHLIMAARGNRRVR
jgi:peptidoglycan/xylan/chitin deacetylase (PgdA/CDA1 family)